MSFSVCLYVFVVGNPIINTVAGSMNDNIHVHVNMDNTVAGSMNDNIHVNMDKTVAGSMNDNINI
jgi:hypothetical protein